MNPLWPECSSQHISPATRDISGLGVAWAAGLVLPVAVILQGYQADLAFDPSLYHQILFSRQIARDDDAATERRNRSRQQA